MKNEIVIHSEQDLKSKIYTIRGVQVMLDFDLAEIYGYSVKAFNQQVKNNIEKFDEDFDKSWVCPPRHCHQKRWFSTGLCPHNMGFDKSLLLRLDQCCCNYFFSFALPCFFVSTIIF